MSFTLLPSKKQPRAKLAVREGWCWICFGAPRALPPLHDNTKRWDRPYSNLPRKFVCGKRRQLACAPLKLCASAASRSMSDCRRPLALSCRTSSPVTPRARRGVHIYICIREDNFHSARCRAEAPAPVCWFKHESGGVFGWISTCLRRVKKHPTGASSPRH